MAKFSDLSEQADRLSWLDGENVRPYVFVREDNRVKNPGQLFDSDWFPFSPVYFNPLLMDEVSKVDQILALEHKAFQSKGMEMDRWVFYDCAIVPGFVAGFAQKTETLAPSVRKAIAHETDREWTPISLFIIIPTMAEGEWVAHNLSSVNALIPAADRYYGLGFLTKAFGLWYANIEVCIGMTQWESPALKLHAHYGAFEVLTAYTPAHSFAHTLTYRLRMDPRYWACFFTKRGLEDFRKNYVDAGFQVDPKDDESLIAFQRRIEEGAGPFYLDSHEIRQSALGFPLKVYKPL